MFKKIRRLAAYLFVKSLLGVATLLPRKVGLKIFALVGSLAFYLHRKARRVALTNLKLVYGSHLSDKEIRRMARKTFTYLGKFTFDVAKLPRYSRKTLAAITKVEGVENLDKALARGRGVIALTGHIGNWELLAAYFARMGYKVNAVATPLRDPRLNKLIVTVRESAGVKVLDRKKDTREVMRCLRRGEILGVLIDQDTSVQSVIVDFLGKPARTAAGPVRLASRTGAAIVPLAMLMDDNDNYVIQVKEPVYIGDGGNRLEKEVERCSKLVESFINREPCQWVWVHKRWKSIYKDLYN